MKAMILAAGLGTRLRPLTDHIPKALVQVGGVPMLQRLLDKLTRSGCREIVVNVYHFPDQIREFLSTLSYPGAEIHISDESGCLLDTGGGLLKAAGFLQGTEPVLVHNVDIVSDLDLALLEDVHRETRALATLVVRNRNTRRTLLFNQNMRLYGWMDCLTGETRKVEGTGDDPVQPFAFSGIHIINPQIFSIIQQQGRFSIIDAYLDLAAGYPVLGFRDTSSFWMDIGKPEQLTEAGQWLTRDDAAEEP